MSAPIGILMLDTGFLRIPGDVGCPETFPFPVRYARVAGASVGATVHGDPAPLLGAFVEAGLRLAGEGCIGVTTTCGFLSLFQRELAARLPVPVATSALLQIRSVAALLAPGRRPGIVTYSAVALTPAHLEAAGAPPDIPVRGLDPGGALATMIRGERPDLDREAAGRETVAACLALVADHPETGAIVLECANLPPYRAAVAAATGLPVFDAVTMIGWFRAALLPAAP
ncbi:aspartate/glutamate racemase family protein [Arenibaculum sp.]|uniref:aspartate/glutamate racemase family protein n=1 Tax=Arenibaculum sp. TaxID=2865862 RepID=UPI002E12B500|nr:aspartate/glutamate racemase family protein [Arenibaculum sp.]